MSETLADVLNQHLTNRGWSFERLAKESGLPRNTVYRWTRSEDRRVRRWQRIVTAARALGLNTSQANALLASSGHPTTEALLQRSADEQDRVRLAHWRLTTPSNLPAQLTSLIGRQDELERLTYSLSSARLVTLTGPGGSGKTRLALEAAQSVLDEFEELAFVDLTPVRDPNLLILTIARPLGRSEPVDEPPLLALGIYLMGEGAGHEPDEAERVGRTRVPGAGPHPPLPRLQLRETRAQPLCCPVCRQGPRRQPFVHAHLQQRSDRRRRMRAS